MKQITIGLVAHVDAGKTTTIESILYEAGAIRHFGRVDHQDAFLDYNEQERSRGITIYAKEARFTWHDAEVCLIDTPGHIDFSSEMERTLQVLDAAILIINGQDGVQSHTRTIWDCLQHYHIPTYVFVNKMDISYQTPAQLMADLQKECSENCIHWNQEDTWENCATINDEMLEAFVENGTIDEPSIRQAIRSRELFPVCFGSALKREDIKELIDLAVRYTEPPAAKETFGAKVFLVTEDEQGHPLTHIKMTGGTLKVKETIDEQKVDQIRLYHGTSYTAVEAVQAGMICALKGLKDTYPGQGLGSEPDSEAPVLQAYMSYQMMLPETVDPLQMMNVLEPIAREDPQLQIEYDERRHQISVRIMGEMQMQVLQKTIADQCGVTVGFQAGKVVLKETIAEPVYGVGHFEPLRHYAEVLLKIEPLPRGAGIKVDNRCPMEHLAYNWQSAIVRQLTERTQIGVLTGSALTDVKFTLLDGKANVKHTSGGDFRQATSRAVRQGLMKAQNILLEPYYQFTITVPNAVLSNVLYDLDQRGAQVDVAQSDNQMIITGTGPVRQLANYQMRLTAITKGQGTFTCTLAGYEESPDAEALIQAAEYDPESDRRHPTGSVFCTHGSSFSVPYDEVENYMHLQWDHSTSSGSYHAVRYTISEEEAKRVFSQVSGRNRSEKKIDRRPKKKIDLEAQPIRSQTVKPTCIVVDGYNQIFSWDSLRELARKDYDAARDRLIQVLVDYQAFHNYRMILVFDAYRVPGSQPHDQTLENTTIVYTRHGQTADSYIEKIVGDLQKEYNVIVASSDGLIQNSILAQGARRMSSRELEHQALRVSEQAKAYIK